MGIITIFRGIIHHHPRRAFRGCQAFTLLELLVVVAVIAILASLLLPVLNKGKRKAQGIYCLNNLRQLQMAWVMYAHDHAESLPPNSDGEHAGTDPAHPAWVAGWLLTDSETGSKYDSTNTDLLVGPHYAEFGSIGSYVQNSKIYRCPADKSMVTVNGVRYPRTRSMSMNTYMNGNGIWQSTEYVTFRKSGDMPNSSGLWVFIDEREDSINDGCFGTDVPRTYGIVDYPASYHNGAGGLAFADGHSEYHRWLEPTTTPALNSGEHLPLGSKYTSWQDRDMAWLNARTTVKK
ncbi:MAG: xcpT 2 [Pedosphaera sp.]|nr:xcpT 2 [Pedosphaera sp.]